MRCRCVIKDSLTWNIYAVSWLRCGKTKERGVSFRAHKSKAAIRRRINGSEFYFMRISFPLYKFTGSSSLASPSKLDIKAILQALLLGIFAYGISPFRHLSTYHHKLYFEDIWVARSLLQQFKLLCPLLVSSDLQKYEIYYKCNTYVTCSISPKPECLVYL